MWTLYYGDVRPIVKISFMGTFTAHDLTESHKGKRIRFIDEQGTERHATLEYFDNFDPRQKVKIGYENDEGERIIAEVSHNAPAEVDD